MHQKLLDYLACPESGQPLALEDSVLDDRGRIASGRLVSSAGHEYPIVDHVPRFVDHDAHVSSFSRQRRYMKDRFEEWKREEGRLEMFERSTSFDLAATSPALFLDAGCGYGRLTEVVARSGHEVIGIDMSSASMELARDFVGDSDNVHLIQGDLTKLPLKPSIVDFAFSIGVLHHTSDPETSFSRLVPALKPGGRLAVWVYPPEMKRIDDIVRIVTTRLPRSLVFQLCRLLPLVYTLSKKLRGQALPANYGYWPCVMGFFDSLTPQYASVHEPDEVSGWFEKQSFEDIRVLDRRTSACGQKP